MKPIAQLLLAHGAGAPVQSEFIQDLICSLEQRRIRVIAFNFKYMQKQIALGKKHPPSRSEKLIVEFAERIENIDTDLPLFLGGKSMGGRMATMVMAQQECQKKAKEIVKGVVVYGYPFHPPYKPEKTRLEHFPSIQVPVAILQGQRDTFGTQSEVLNYSLPNNVTVDFINDGDHSFKPRKASGFIFEHNMQTVADKTCTFIKQQLKSN